MTNSRKPKGPKQRPDDENDPPVGVRCPSCSCAHAPVYYTREKLGHVVRVRECRNCGRRFTTREQVG
jgi:hypothetical protein